MIFWILAGVETLLQMGLGIGLYAKCSGEVHKGNRWRDGGLLLYLLFLYVIEVYDKKFSMLSTGTILTGLLLETVWLLLWFRGSVLKAFCWSFFYGWTIAIVKMPALIIYGLYRGKGSVEVNNNPTLAGEMLKCILIVFLITAFFIWKNQIIQTFQSICKEKKYILFLLGTGEMVLTIYMFNTIIEYLQVTALVLNVVLIISLCLLIIIIIIWVQYCLEERKNQIFLSREKLLQFDYGLIRQEQNNNLKLCHDHKYDLSYLYECLEKGDREKGMDYIEKKLEIRKHRQKNEVWTGVGCIDFLLSNGKEQAKEKNIRFSIDVDITKLPVAEYDFFVILGNLLDNAFEASEKCPLQERFVKLKIYMVNGMFMFILENSYVIEPQKRKGKFFSSKGEGNAHGWGLENVKEMVEKNNGTLEVEYGNGIFKVQLVFGLGGKDD